MSKSIRLHITYYRTTSYLVMMKYTVTIFTLIVKYGHLFRLVSSSCSLITVQIKYYYEVNQTLFCQKKLFKYNSTIF